MISWLIRILLLPLAVMIEVTGPRAETGSPRRLQRVGTSEKSASIGDTDWGHRTIHLGANFC
jgi:hypothetical protein